MTLKGAKKSAIEALKAGEGLYYESSDGSGGAYYKGYDSKSVESLLKAWHATFYDTRVSIAVIETNKGLFPGVVVQVVASNEREEVEELKTTIYYMVFSPIHPKVMNPVATNYGVKKLYGDLEIKKISFTAHGIVVVKDMIKKVIPSFYSEFTLRPSEEDSNEELIQTKSIPAVRFTDDSLKKVRIEWDFPSVEKIRSQYD